MGETNRSRVVGARPREGSELFTTRYVRCTGVAMDLNYVVFVLSSDKCMLAMRLQMFCGWTSYHQGRR